MKSALHAVIDLGSNTAILLIYHPPPHFKVVQEVFRIPRLAEGLRSGGEIKQEALQRAIAALGDFAKIIAEQSAHLRCCGGTAPFRKMHNAADIIDQIKSATGITVTILSPEQEAKASFIAALNVPATGKTVRFQKNAVVLDIGGGSCELAWGQPSHMQGYNSVAVGCIDLTERYLAAQLEKTATTSAEELAKAQAQIMAHLPQLDLPPSASFYAVAGTPMAIALLEAGIHEYLPSQVDGMSISYTQLLYWRDQLAATPLKDKIERFGIPAGRAEVLLAGAIILAGVMQRYGFKQVIARNAGLRHGLALMQPNAS